MKSRGIWFLLTIFTGALLKEISMLVSFRTNSDYLLFQAAGMPYLYFLLVGAMVVLDGIFILFTIRPQAIAFWSAIASILLARIEELLVLPIGLRNLDLLKERFVEKRAATGRSVEPDMLDLFVSPTALYLGVAITISFSILMLILLWMKRDHYFGNREGHWNR